MASWSVHWTPDQVVGFEPYSDHCVVLVEMLFTHTVPPHPGVFFTHTVPPHPGVLLGTGDLNAGEG